jgi:hypothetical protein
VLATGGVPLGGDLLDSRIMETRRQAPGGRALPARRPARAEPHLLDEELADHRRANRPDLLDIIAARAAAPTSPRARPARRPRHAYLGLPRSARSSRLRSRSTDDRADLRGSATIDITEPIAAPSSRRPSRSSSATPAPASCAPSRTARLEEIDVVITTGGSSLIPAFRRMLEEALPRAQLAATGTFTSVAAGLALAGADHSRDWL